MKLTFRLLSLFIVLLLASGCSLAEIESTTNRLESINNSLASSGLNSNSSNGERLLALIAANEEASRQAEANRVLAERRKLIAEEAARVNEPDDPLEEFRRLACQRAPNSSGCTGIPDKKILVSQGDFREMLKNGEGDYCKPVSSKMEYFECTQY